MTLPKETPMIEKCALAAWLEYTGYSERFRPDYDDGGEWEEGRAGVLLQWEQTPELCTHAGAKAFRECTAAVLTELLDPDEGMLRAANEARGKPTHAVSASILRTMLNHVLNEGEG